MSFKPTMSKMPEYTKPPASKLPWRTAILTVVCIALAIVFHFRWARPVSQWPIHLPMRRYTFTDHPELLDFDDEAAGERWEQMVTHPEWWTTQWRDESGRQFPRGIDVFHKMHCLIALRAEFVNLVSDPTREGGYDTRDLEVNKRKLDLTINKDHLQHCFDFLRQDILCAADMTLEPLGPGYIPTDGDGVEHECRDWRVLLDHMGLEDMDEI